MAQPHQDSRGDVFEDSKRDRTLDTEGKPQSLHERPNYEDPFGNEEFAEVRYRTLRWW